MIDLLINLNELLAPRYTTDISLKELFDFPVTVPPFISKLPFWVGSINLFNFFCFRPCAFPLSFPLPIFEFVLGLQRWENLFNLAREIWKYFWTSKTLFFFPCFSPFHPLNAPQILAIRAAKVSFFFIPCKKKLNYFLKPFLTIALPKITPFYSFETLRLDSRSRFISFGDYKVNTSAYPHKKNWKKLGSDCRRGNHPGC